jgi:D-tyrosyl-tRNA(Tyr) deacylase
MIAVVQRVSRASVTVGEVIVGQIGPGLAVLVSVCQDDTERDVDWTARKLAGIRLFPEGEKGFHLDVREAGGSVLLVSNFTVAAATRHGRRPSFDAAADAQKGAELFAALVEAMRSLGVPTETGSFGADMQVSLVNDGPVTVIINSSEAR